MAWIKACEPASSWQKSDVVLDGVINPDYVKTGTIAEDTGYLTVTCTSGQNGGTITGVDLTNYSTLSFDAQNNSSSCYAAVRVSGTNVSLPANTTRQTLTLNVSGVTGIQPIELFCFGSWGTFKVYNITLS